MFQLLHSCVSYNVWFYANLGWRSSEAGRLISALECTGWTFFFLMKLTSKEISILYLVWCLIRLWSSHFGHPESDKWMLPVTEMCFFLILQHYSTEGSIKALLKQRRIFFWAFPFSLRNRNHKEDCARGCKKISDRPHRVKLPDLESS